MCHTTLLTAERGLEVKESLLRSVDGKSNSALLVLGETPRRRFPDRFLKRSSVLKWNPTASVGGLLDFTGLIVAWELVARDFLRDFWLKINFCFVSCCILWIFSSSLSSAVFLSLFVCSFSLNLLRKKMKVNSVSIVRAVINITSQPQAFLEEQESHWQNVELSSAF